MSLVIEYEPDDLPDGYPDVWGALVTAVDLWRTTGQRLHGERKLPDGEAAARDKARQKTERWKEQHRRAARESARRRRAARKGKR